MKCFASIRVAALVLGLVALPGRCVGQVRFGLDFSPPEEGAAVPYGWLFAGLDIMSPFDLTDPGNHFVLDGAFAGRDEAEIRRAIRNRVEDLYRAVDTGDQTTTLAITFDEGFRDGPGSENIVLGAGESSPEILGLAFLGTALDPARPDGFAGSVVLLNNMDDTAALSFETFEEAINAVANVTAHEIGHNLALKHVYVDGAVPDSPPYPVMATGALDLPVEALLADAEFKTSGNAEEGGVQMSAGMLLAAVGTVTLGDYNLDGAVSSADLLQVSPFWHHTNIAFQEGDVDGDHDLDSDDLMVISELFGTQAAPQGFPGGVGAGTFSQTVPEPSMLLLCGASLAYMALRRPRGTRAARQAGRTSPLRYCRDIT